MPRLRCTQKLLKIIDIPRVIAGEETGTTLLGDWYANLLVISRQRALLFTNESTLYSFAVLEVRKTTLIKITQVFIEQLTLNLEYENLPGYVIERVAGEYRHLRLADTVNRSVQGSMNNLAYLLKHYVRDAGGAAVCDVRKLNAQFNHMPQQPLGWKFAIEALQERLLGVVTMPGPEPRRVFLN